jgi:hypothetical protein
MTQELQLILAASPAQPSPSAQAAIQRLVGSALDWTLVLKLAAAHAVRPLVLRNLAPHLPEKHLALLRGECATIAAHNLFLTGELLRVLPVLWNAGIPAITFKGPALAHQLYGDVTLREFSDLDLQAPRHLVWTAAALLETQGYICTYTAGEQVREDFIDSECEVMLTHPAGHTVDLHWEFSGSFYRPFPINPPVEPAHIDLLGGVLRTFSTVDAALFAIGHLSRHGSWSVKGTSEISTILGALNDDQWGQVLDGAGRQGCRRMALFAASAAAGLHHAALPPAVAALIEPPPEWLAQVARLHKAMLAGSANQLPGALSRLNIRLRHFDTPAIRCIHAIQWLCAPRKTTWTTHPRFARLVHHLLHPAKSHPHPRP